MTKSELRMLMLCLNEMGSAVTKHPEFPETDTAGMAVMLEEVLEFVQAVNDGDDVEHTQVELAHVIVTAFRLLTKIEDKK